MPKADAPSNVSNETILHYMLGALKLKRVSEEANGEYRSFLKQAKAAGCDTAAIITAINSKKLDPEAIHERLRNEIRYLSALNMPVTQADLFEGLDTAPVNAKAQSDLVAAQADDAGYNAGKDGSPVENCPYPPGSDLMVKWRAGWDKGQAFLARQFGPDAKPASTRMKKERTRGDAEAPAKPAAKPKLAVVETKERAPRTH